MSFNKEALKSMIEDSGVSFKQNGKSFIFTCPKCSKKDKLYIRKTDGRFVCWHCASNGFQGKAEYALHELIHKSLKQIQESLYGNSPQLSGVHKLILNIKDFYDDNEEIAEEANTIATIYPPDFYPIDHPFSDKGVQYLEGRGIPLDIAKEYNIQYWSTRKRIIFPVIRNNQVLGWEARTIEPNEWINEETGEKVSVPKTLTLETMKKDKLLMFEDRLIGASHAVICEGAIDAIKCHLCNGNIATMGKNVSKYKLDIIRASGIKKIYVALDPDAAKEISNMVKCFGDLEVYHMKPLEGKKDLGEMSFSDCYSQFLNARRVVPASVFVYIRVPKLYSIRS